MCPYEVLDEEIISEEPAILSFNSPATAAIRSLEAESLAPGSYMLVNGLPHRLEYTELLGSRLVLIGDKKILCNYGLVAHPVLVAGVKQRDDKGDTGNEGGGGGSKAPQSKESVRAASDGGEDATGKKPSGEVHDVATASPAEAPESNGEEVV